MSQLQHFQDTAKKMGILSNSVCRRAVELDRLCQVRCSGGGLASLSFTGSCRTVLCLELAATSQGERFDQKLAVKLSGLTSTSYKSSLQTLRRLLELEESYSLRDIAVKFGCSEAVTKAQEMLARYVKDFEVTASDRTKDDVDFNRPLFSCSALYAVCRQMKIKVDKSKMIELAGVKRTAFDRLVAILQNLEKEPQDGKSSKAKKRVKHWLDDLEELADEEDLKKKRKSLEAESKDEEDDYEEWKRKILAATESCDT
ncbi:origin recognition complex subunit 6-like [Apostichopus japonicus]|uniref:origin recognition complex subunit 6-like n=1 Tax=Stichopus japonicus TaxID=307972 RepID=UPI003AB8564E